MENMEIYNKISGVPENAKKKIQGGRLKGMTDIKPMWRIEKLTELFDLYYKLNGEWSEPIQGTGGSSFISNEKNGLYTSDECFKMAYTDALSVACKSLGMGADVYWGDSKYAKNDNKDENQNERQVTENTNLVTDAEAKSIYNLMTRKGLKVVEELKKNYGIDNTSKLTKEQYFSILNVCNGLPDKK